MIIPHERCRKPTDPYIELCALFRNGRQRAKHAICFWRIWHARIKYDKAGHSVPSTSWYRTERVCTTPRWPQQYDADCSQCLELQFALGFETSRRIRPWSIAFATSWKSIMNKHPRRTRPSSPRPDRSVKRKPFRSSTCSYQKTFLRRSKQGSSPGGSTSIHSLVH